MATSVIKKDTSDDLIAIHVAKQITIPANSGIDIDVSSYIPSGKTIKCISGVRLGNYILPYLNPTSGARTWVANIVDESKIRIQNTSSAWTNYWMHVLLYVN